MRSTERLALVIVFACAAAPARADELTRLRSENEQLRRDLAETRARVAELETLLGRLAPTPQDATVMRMPPDAGATTPADLADELLAGVTALGSPVAPGALTELSTRLGPFAPGPRGEFLVATDAWQAVRPDGAPVAPDRFVLEQALDALRLTASGRRLVGLELHGGDAAPHLQLRLAAEGAAARVDVYTVRVDGRLLVVAVRLPWLEDNARAALGVLRQTLGTRPGRTGAAALPSPTTFAAADVVVGPVSDERALELPGYRLSVQALPNGEWGAVAEPIAGAGRRLTCGPIPGEHDPRRDPYRVRPDPR